MKSSALRYCNVCEQPFTARVRPGYTQQFCSSKCCAKANPPPRAVVPPIAARFASFHTVGDGCWVWQGSKNRDGYGLFMRDGRRRPGRRCERASRVSWELHRGPIPRGLWVLHKCDNPSCVNPDHLFLGTVQDNVADMMRKGRHFWHRNRGQLVG